MRRLEVILKTADKDQRLRALREYARSLNVDIAEARNEQGQLVENRLVILIYDARAARRARRNENLGVFFGSFILFVVLAVVLWMVVKILK